MKVKNREIRLERLLLSEKPAKKNPPNPSFIFRLLVRILAIGELRKTKFTYKFEGIKKLPKGPCLVLMNHSSFIDLKIASKILFTKKYNIVATSDAMLGKEWLMRRLGCVPTNKFAPDVSLVFDILRILKKKKRSVLLYPEAGYSFDGTAVTLPKSVTQLVRAAGVPVISIITDGAYLYDPLYNQLQKRKVKVSATVKQLVAVGELKTLSPSEIEKRIADEFSFDNFKSQLEKGVLVTEKFRADGLHRVLYRCPNCNSEGCTVGEGETLTCTKCGKVYRLEENGQMKALSGETEFSHIPDWFKYQRESVKAEIEKGEYHLETEVDVGAIYGYKSFNLVGKGKLIHDTEGFKLQIYGFEPLITQSPTYSYSINADFFWYEGQDIISFGNNEILYYCFFDKNVPVAKVRLAAEEMFKLFDKRNKKA